METTTSPLIKPELDSNNHSKADIPKLYKMTETENVEILATSQIIYDNSYQLNNMDYSPSSFKSIAKSQSAPGFAKIKSETDSRNILDSPTNNKNIPEVTSTSLASSTESSPYVSDNTRPETISEKDSELKQDYSPQKPTSSLSQKSRSINTAQLDVLAYVTVNTPPISRTTKKIPRDSKIATPYNSRNVFGERVNSPKYSKPRYQETNRQSDDSGKDIYGTDSKQHSDSLNSKCENDRSNNINLSCGNSSDSTQSEDEESWQRRSSKAKRIALKFSNTQSPCQKALLSTENQGLGHSTPNRTTTYSQNNPPSLLSPTPLSKSSASRSYKPTPSPFIDNSSYASKIASARHFQNTNLSLVERNRSTLENPLHAYPPLQPQHQSKTPMRFKSHSQNFHNNSNSKTPKAPNSSFISRSSANFPPTASPIAFKSNSSAETYTSPKIISTFLADANSQQQQQLQYNQQQQQQLQHTTPNKKRQSNQTSHQHDDGETTETDEETASLPPFSPIFYTSKKNSLSNHYAIHENNFPQSEKIYRKLHGSAERSQLLSQLQSPTSKISKKVSNKRRKEAGVDDEQTNSTKPNPSSSIGANIDAELETRSSYAVFSDKPSPHLFTPDRTRLNARYVSTTRRLYSNPQPQRITYYRPAFEKASDFESLHNEHHGSLIAAPTRTVSSSANTGTEAGATTKNHTSNIYYSPSASKNPFVNKLSSASKRTKTGRGEDTNDYFYGQSDNQLYLSRFSQRSNHLTSSSASVSVSATSTSSTSASGTMTTAATTLNTPALGNGSCGDTTETDEDLAPVLPLQRLTNTPGARQYPHQHSFASSAPRTFAKNNTNIVQNSPYVLDTTRSHQLKLPISRNATKDSNQSVDPNSQHRLEMTEFDCSRTYKTSKESSSETKNSMALNESIRSRSRSDSQNDTSCPESASIDQSVSLAKSTNSIKKRKANKSRNFKQKQEKNSKVLGVNISSAIHRKQSTGTYVDTNEPIDSEHQTNVREKPNLAVSISNSDASSIGLLKGTDQMEPTGDSIDKLGQLVKTTDSGLQAHLVQHSGSITDKIEAIKSSHCEISVQQDSVYQEKQSQTQNKIQVQIQATSKTKTVTHSGDSIHDSIKPSLSSCEIPAQCETNTSPKMEMSSSGDTQKKIKSPGRKTALPVRRSSRQLKSSTSKPISNEQFFESQNNPFC